MRLADRFLAARGTMPDLGSFCMRMAPAIQEAQRFEIADDVARAAMELVYSRPSTLVAALPLCRLPYPVMWLEWRGGLGKHNRADAPIPTKQGVLIESMDGQVGFMTFGWVHDDNTRENYGVEHAVNISPIGVYFDWRPDGDVRQIVRQAHETILNNACAPGMERECVQIYREGFERKFINVPDGDDTALSTFFTTFKHTWKKLAGNKRELEALRTLDRHMAPGLSPHGVGLVSFIMETVGHIGTEKEAIKFMEAWERDVEGEGTFIECLLAMLNSRNPVVEHNVVDLTKLNRSRRRSGKPEFLPYTKTQLRLSRSQARIAQARGVDRETARQHLVMGHFKIRRSGVYWWQPFLRGDPSKGRVQREEYDVQT